MNKKYKWGDCIQCGDCCIEAPCGLPDNPAVCELLTPINDYQYECPHWPFERFDGFIQLTMGARAGCSNPNTERYKEVWLWLKSRRVQNAIPTSSEQRG